MPQRRSLSLSAFIFTLLALTVPPSIALAQKIGRAGTPTAHAAATKPMLDGGNFFGFLVHGAWEAANAFWYAWALLAAVTLTKWFLAYKRQARLAAAGIDEIDRMDGREFEERLAVLFGKLDYAVQLTPYAGDWGGDLVIEKGDVKTVVQAKRYKKAVGVRAVQEAVAAKAKYGCAEAMVVTNSVYTRQAEELARVNRVTLWGRERLVHALLSTRKGAAETAPIPVLRTVTTAKPVLVYGSSPAANSLCDTCRKPVSEKVAAFCAANTARFGGRVYCFDHQKQVARRDPAQSAAW